MSATQFTDDAYNKFLSAESGRHGTLVGNWFEENIVRDGSLFGPRFQVDDELYEIIS